MSQLGILTAFSAQPLAALLETVLPALAADSRDQVILIMEQAKKNNEEISIQDGFDLYKELTQVRRVHKQALPE